MGVEKINRKYDPEKEYVFTAPKWASALLRATPKVDRPELLRKLEIALNEQLNEQLKSRNT